MSGEVIEIRFHEDLPTKAQNRLRYALELGAWRRRWRHAEANKNYELMDALQRDFELVGLP